MPNKKKSAIRIDHYDREIIRFLGRKGESSTNQIADGADFSWATALKHLRKLKGYGFVLTNFKRNKIYWRLRFK